MLTRRGCIWSICSSISECKFISQERNAQSIIDDRSQPKCGWQERTREGGLQLQLPMHCCWGMGGRWGWDNDAWPILLLINALWRFKFGWLDLQNFWRNSRQENAIFPPRINRTWELYFCLSLRISAPNFWQKSDLADRYEISSLSGWRPCWCTCSRSWGWSSTRSPSASDTLRLSTSPHLFWGKRLHNWAYFSL